jgi:hypothetical protein
MCPAGQHAHGQQNTVKMVFPVGPWLITKQLPQCCLYYPNGSLYLGLAARRGCVDAAPDDGVSLTVLVELATKLCALV